jgi:hypothetical protein
LPVIVGGLLDTSSVKNIAKHAELTVKIVFGCGLMPSSLVEPYRLFGNPALNFRIEE